MQEFHRRVTAVRAEPSAEETSTALLAGATVIPLADSGDFTEAGGHVRILGTVYEFDAMDEGDESGVPSITLTSGLLVDVPAETMVEEWNSARGEVITDWVATVTDEVDGSSNEALLSHTLIGMISTGIPVVGESVVVQVDDAGTWWVVNVVGATPGYSPEFIRTGGLGADTVVWAGTEDGRRAQLDGIDGALECYNDANDQTVNLDGEDNYIEGTLATAADGSRVEVGPGVLFALPANEVRFYSGSADEVEPAKLTAYASPIAPGVEQGMFDITGHEWDVAGTVPLIRLFASTTGALANISLVADEVYLGADSVAVEGTLDATMAAGSVGTGAFRDSVDARVTAVAPGAVPAASETVQGKVELATTAEVVTGTDTARAVTPAGVKAATDALNSTSLGHVERAADATQTIATSASTLTTVLFQSSVVTARGGISYNTGTGQFTVTAPGRYIINAVVSFSSNTSGRRLAQIVQNGTTRKSTNASAPTAGNSVSLLTGIFDCAASDVLEIKALQDSGSTLTVQAATNITISNLGA